MITSEFKWDDLMELIQSTNSAEQLRELLNFLFTHEEKEHVVTRINLIRELLMGKRTQREIAKALNVSIAKITRGSNNLKTVSADLRRFLVTELVASE